MKLYKYCTVIALVLVTVTAQAQTLPTAKDSLSYAIGFMMAKNMQQQGVKDISYDQLKTAIQHVMEGQPTLMDKVLASELFGDYLNQLKEESSKGVKLAGEAFLAENGRRAGVTVLPSGLQYEVITAGTGETPGPTQKVRTHYHGTLIDGTVFDSSVERGEPISFPVNGVIQGWQEALQLMKVGDKWKLFIPQALAYGARGAGGVIQPYTALVFEIELLGIE